MVFLLLVWGWLCIFFLVFFMGICFICLVCLW